jgi:hypothetical protein
MQSSEDRNLIELLMMRLERISADSYWAHRASGVRGSLIRILDGIDAGLLVSSIDIKQITDLGFYILEQASIIIKNNG